MLECFRLASESVLGSVEVLSCEGEVCDSARQIIGLARENVITAIVPVLSIDCIWAY